VNYTTSAISRAAERRRGLIIKKREFAKAIVVISMMSPAVFIELTNHFSGCNVRRCTENVFQAQKA